MAKVFMSILGTNPYVEVFYEFGKKRSIFTPFVQEAYLNLTKKDWSNNDRLIFFLTDEALKKNWHDNGNFQEGLFSRLKKLSLPPEIIPVSFKDGHSEDEIMENFLTIVNQLEEEDEVIFDITHSFRSLPMLTLVALNYAKMLKNIQIKSIHYGAFEVLGPPPLVKDMPKEERVAPVFDLTPYVRLLDWSFAVDEFSRFGIAERLVELVKAKAIPILRETKGKDEQAKNLRDFVDYLQGLSTRIKTSRCRGIMEGSWRKLALKKADYELFLPPFAPLVAKIEMKIEGFLREDPWEKAKTAVEWCIEHDLIQQGYTILEEAVITEVLRLMEKDLYDKQNREFVSSLLQVTAQKVQSQHWKGILGAWKREGLEWQKRGENSFKKLSKSFDSLARHRNDINHCGTSDDSKKEELLIGNLGVTYQEIVSSLEALKLELME